MENLFYAVFTAQSPRKLTIPLGTVRFGEDLEVPCDSRDVLKTGVSLSERR
jgi:hypothetical protein